MWSIYKYTCKITGKSYIGQTKGTLDYRAGSNGSGYRHSIKFYAAIQKYGWENFTCEILETDIEDQATANQREQYWISYYDTIKNGYNILPGGQINNTDLFRKIYQIDVDKNIVAKFNSAADANRQLFPSMPYWHATEILKCCHKTRSNTEGLYFCFADEYNDYQIPLTKYSYNVILQLTIDGKILNTFKSFAESSKQTGISVAHIKDCCDEQRKSAGGYRWCYEINYKNYVISDIEEWPKAKEVLQIDKKTNKIIKKFPSANIASKETNIARGNISSCCRGEIPSAGGYIWKFNENYLFNKETKTLMEKEQVKKFDLEAAFKALDEIEIPVTKGIKANRVNFKEALSQKPAHEILIEDYFNIGDSEALEEAQDERDGEVAQAKLDRIEKIVDLDADSPDDLLPSYVGKVIIQCPQCMTLFYKNPEDIDYSEENPDVVNINEICQHCGNSSGYTLIGKVGAVDNNEPTDNFEAPVEENPLDLDFDTEAAEGEEVPEEPAEEAPAEESEEDLDLNLEDLPDEEEEKNESLNLSKEAQSDFETEHKSENLTLNEEAVNESINNSEAQKDAEEGSELKTENESENLTLNEEVDKDLDKKLDAHNDYIDYLKNSINAKEEALKNENNEEIKVAIQNELVALQNSLEAALPDALKTDAIADNAEPIEAPEDTPAEEPAEAEAPVEEPVEEAPVEEPKDEEPAVEEQLTEEVPATEEPAADTVNYVDYKHSYCHILQPMLKKINYLCNILSDDKADLEKCKNVVLAYLKKAPELKYTRKEQEFFDNVKAQETKRDLYNYIKNSINKAKEIEVKVDENGELVEGLNEGFEPVEESLNASEEATSDYETENGSENLTLNESLTEATQSEDISAALTNFIDNLETPVETEVAAAEPVVEESLNEDTELDSALIRFIDSLPENLEESADLNEADYNVSDAEFRQLIHSKAFNESTESVEEALPPSSVVDRIVDKISHAGEDVEEDLEEGCENGECEKPLEECGEKPLKEEAEEPEAEEEAPVEEAPVEGEEVSAEEAEEDTKEEPTPIETTVEEVKDVALDAAKAALAEEEAAEVILPEEDVKEITDEVVEQKLETPAEEAEEEAPIEDEEVPAEEATEFSEDDIDDLDECSLNKHIDEYLKEVYSNVKCFEATDCRLTEGKLFVEGKISFNSGREKLTMFEFLPAYGEDKLFFEGYNKDFSENKAFTLNCSINESKTLTTESFGYKYKINENLVEGLK